MAAAALAVGVSAFQAEAQNTGAPKEGVIAETVQNLPANALKGVINQDVLNALPSSGLEKNKTEKDGAAQTLGSLPADVFKGVITPDVLKAAQKNLK